MLGFDLEGARAAIKARIDADDKLSIRSVAKRASIDHKTLGAVLKTTENPGINTVYNVLDAVGLSLVDFVDCDESGRGTPEWTPSDDTISLLLEVALSVLPEARASSDDIQAAAHGVVEGLKLFAESPSMQSDEGFQEAVSARIRLAVREHRKRRAPAA